MTAAPALIAARGLTDRISIAEGDFFEGVPAGSDVYILSHIIHDWSEAQCLTILGHLRRAMTPESRLLIVESSCCRPAASRTSAGWRTW